MPIDPIHLQRRHAEQGRIRLGHKTETQGGKIRPAKLETFRFTSPNSDLIKALAELYGGEAKAWDNSGVPEWEVYSEAKSLPVIVVAGGVSQWFEHWTAAGIGHRCDGTRDSKTNQLCNPEDPLHKQAIQKPTTRLSVILEELDSTGVWRLESHGWNAAAEIPMLGELAAHVGSMVPARLHLVERRKVIQVQGKPQTSRFVVPVLDLEIKVRELAQIVSGTSRSAIGGAPADQQQIGSGKVPTEADLLELYTPQIEACQSTEEVNTLWRHIASQDHLYPAVKEALVARGTSLQATTPEKPPARPTVTERDQEPQSGPGEEIAEVVEEDPPLGDPLEDDRAWQDLVAFAGTKGIKPADLMAAFAKHSGHPVDQGNAAEYRAFQGSL